MRNFDIGPNVTLISNKLQGVSTVRKHGPSVTTVFMLFCFCYTFWFLWRAETCKGKGKGQPKTGNEGPKRE
jgi:threonine/homoserine/homoserine lactone efflux protein